MIDQDFPGACILLDGALVVMHVSRAAQSMMRGDAVLTVRQQRVHARDDPHTLTRCLALAARGGRSAMTIARPGQAALTLRVEPRHAADGRQVLVTLRDPDLEIPDPLLLQGLFGLTATEALVAVGLARGQTSAELAQGMGVQPNTVLSHIKRLLVKSGASRQSQLVSLILRSAAMPHPWSVGACTAQMGNDTVADGRHSASRHGRAPAAPAECRCHHERKHA